MIRVIDKTSRNKKIGVVELAEGREGISGDEKISFFKKRTKLKKKIMNEVSNKTVYPGDKNAWP